MNAHNQPRTPAINVDMTQIPPLLDVKGVRTHIAPVGRTLLYQAATTGDIETVSLGMGKRGKRLFVAASIVAWINRRAIATQKPNLKSKGTTPLAEKPARGNPWGKFSA